MILMTKPHVGRSRTGARPLSAALYFLTACGMSALASVAAIATPEFSRWLLAIALLGAFTVIGLWSPFSTLIISVVYVVLQGLLRRLLPETGTSSLGDPLLLVLPALAILMTSFHVHRSPLDLLAKVILGIQVAMAVSVLNPLGAGITSGVAQFIVVALPLTWFWVASRAASIDAARLRVLLIVIVGLGVAAAAYGRFQVTAGFPSWDQAWIDEKGITSLFLGDFIRPFASFTAASDYATFVGLSLMATVALLLSPSTRSVTAKVALLAALGLLVHELIVQGSRGIMLTSIVPVVIGLLVRTGLRLRYAIAIAVVGLMLLPTVVGSSDPDGVTTASDTNSAALARQAQGLSDPFGETSTLPGHIARLVNGVTTGFELPLGHGVSVIGLDGSFGSSSSQGTETAYGDLGVSLGLLGTGLGVLFAGALLWRLQQQPRSRRDESYWLLLVMAVLPLGPPLVAGNYAAQVTYYALLGCAWTVLKQSSSNDNVRSTTDGRRSSPPITMSGAARPHR